MGYLLHVVFLCPFISLWYSFFLRQHPKLTAFITLRLSVLRPKLQTSNSIASRTRQYIELLHLGLENLTSTLSQTPMPQLSLGSTGTLMTRFSFQMFRQVLTCKPDVSHLFMKGTLKARVTKRRRNGSVVTCKKKISICFLVREAVPDKETGTKGKESDEVSAFTQYRTAVWQHMLVLTRQVPLLESFQW